MGAGIATAVGLAGSLYAANQSARAQKRAANQTQELAEPYLNEARLALPRLRELAESYYARLGQDSPYLRAGHTENLSALRRTGLQGLAEIQHTYASRGNLGRARGERLRLADQLLRASNRENLSYGQSQEAYRASTADTYRQLLSALATLGAKGLAPSTSALRTRATADRDLWNTIAKLLGRVAF